MKKIVFICFIITLILAGSFSCKRTKNPAEPNDSEYIVFGDFYGMCQGPKCVQIFKIENGILYRDTLHRYPYQDSIYPAKWEKMPDSKQILKDSLVFNFPSQIKTDTNKYFGIPDAYDQGGIYLESKFNNQDNPKFWIIDNDTKNIPEYLREFTIQIQNNLRLMKN